LRYTLQSSLTTAYIIFWVVPSRFSVAASNGGRFPYSGSLTGSFSYSNSQVSHLPAKLHHSTDWLTDCFTAAGRLAVKIVASPLQHSHSSFRGSCDSWPYFTVRRLWKPSSLTHCNSQIVLFIPSRHEQHRKHCSSLLYFNCCRGNMFVCEAVTQ
jgi:hypothetical protein